MIIKYDESQEKLVRKLLENKNIVIGLDVAECKDKCLEVTYCIRNKVAECKDKCLEVTYCIRNKDDILKVETLQIKEAK